MGESAPVEVNILVGNWACGTLMGYEAELHVPRARWSFRADRPVSGEDQALAGPTAVNRCGSLGIPINGRSNALPDLSLSASAANTPIEPKSDFNSCYAC